MVNRQTPLVLHRYLYDGQRLSEIKDGNGTTLATFSFTPAGRPLAMTAGGSTYYYHFDVFGSVERLMRGDGVLAQRFIYDAWGNAVSAEQGPAWSSSVALNPYRFMAGSGGRWDSDAGLYFFGSRPYDPATGQFLTRATDTWTYRPAFVTLAGVDPEESVDQIMETEFQLTRAAWVAALPTAMSAMDAERMAVGSLMWYAGAPRAAANDASTAAGGSSSSNDICSNTGLGPVYPKTVSHPRYTSGKHKTYLEGGLICAGSNCEHNVPFSWAFVTQPYFCDNGSLVIGQTFWEQSHDTSTTVAADLLMGRYCCGSNMTNNLTLTGPDRKSPWTASCPGGCQANGSQGKWHVWALRNEQWANSNELHVYFSGRWYTFGNLRHGQPIMNPTYWINFTWGAPANNTGYVRGSDN